MSTLSNFAMFVTGAAIGSFVTWRLLKNKYDKIAQEEIDSVKEAFGMTLAKNDEAESDNAVDLEAEAERYDAILNENGYVDYSTRKEEKGGNPDMRKDKPYVIPPEEYGEIYEYDTRNLTYYENGVLTDEDDNVIDDVEGLIGKESLDHFGDYEPDSVHVRNDKMKADFEILRDGTNFKKD